MQYQSNKFISNDTEATTIAEGVSRIITAYDDNMMLVKVRFDGGAVGSPHSHPHSQSTYVLSGEFEFTVGEQTQTVKVGDVIYIAPDAVHGVKCIKAGELLDFFSPLREDFL